MFRSSILLASWNHHVWTASKWAPTSSFMHVKYELQLLKVCTSFPSVIFAHGLCSNILFYTVASTCDFAPLSVFRIPTQLLFYSRLRFMLSVLWEWKKKLSRHIPQTCWGSYKWILWKMIFRWVLSPLKTITVHYDLLRDVSARCNWVQMVHFPASFKERKIDQLQIIIMKQILNRFQPSILII